MINMATFEPQIVSKESIKPSSPTPPHLKNHKLSILDQLSPNIYLPMLFFYYKNESCDNSKIILQLKSSLSQTLSHYYPFAGTIVDGTTIECDDQGADFFETRIGCSLNELLQNPEPGTLNLLYPKGLLWNDTYNGSIVVVQLNIFTCGGIAISISILHKVADGSTCCSFIKDWATIATHNNIISPQFLSSSLTCSKDLPTITQNKLEKGNTITRRFLFDASKIAELKAMVSDSGMQNPSRVEVVTALIYKCALSASRATLGYSRPSLMMQPMNLRPRLSPPLPENSVGNFSWFTISMPKGEEEHDLSSMVGTMREGVAQFGNKFGKNLTPNECYTMLCDDIRNAKKSGDIDWYKCSSLCRYPFNLLDFGWGKPLWVGFYRSEAKNSLLLIDAKGGGIEGWLTLDKQDMDIFEKDEEILAYASMNPSVLDYLF